MDVVNPSANPLRDSHPHPMPKSQPMPHSDHDTRPPHLRDLPAYVDSLDYISEAEKRANAEIARFKKQAIDSAKARYPPMTLTRPQSNARSVKRTRHWRAEFEKILETQILSNIETNRQKMARLKQLKEEHQRLLDEQAEVEVEPEPVPVATVSPDEEIRNRFIADMEMGTAYASPDQQTLSDELEPGLDLAIPQSPSFDRSRLFAIHLGTDEIIDDAASDHSPESVPTFIDGQDDADNDSSMNDAPPFNLDELMSCGPSSSLGFRLHTDKFCETRTLRGGREEDSLFIFEL